MLADQSCLCVVLCDEGSTLQGAIVTLTKGVALEVAEKGIRCNCIAPGPVWTPLVVSSFPTEKVLHSSLL